MGRRALTPATSSPIRTSAGSDACTSTEVARGARARTSSTSTTAMPLGREISTRPASPAGPRGQSPDLLCTDSEDTESSSTDISEDA